MGDAAWDCRQGAIRGAGGACDDAGAFLPDWGQGARGHAVWGTCAVVRYLGSMLFFVLFFFPR